MSLDLAIELCRSASLVALSLSGPALVAAMIVGLVVGVLQAVTQLHDQTVTFVPKLVLLTLVIVLLLPWSLDVITSYATDMIRGAAETI